MLSKLLGKSLLSLEKHEFRIVISSATYFFLLLCAYYILRPIRETMGISRSADDLPFIFLGTMTTLLLIAPVIGALVSKYSRRQFIPIAYRFVGFNLILFFLLLTFSPQAYLFYIGIAFYVWLSAVNMIMISLFWGFMSDGISITRSKILFPMIAVGGTAGAILGSTIAQQFIELLGESYLLLISVVILELVVRLVKKLDVEFDYYSLGDPTDNTSPGQESTNQKQSSKRPAIENHKNSRFFKWTSGIRYTLSSPYVMAIAGYIFFYGLTSTFLYFQQGHLVAESTSDTAQRIQTFANIDLWSNSLTLMMQLFISGFLLKRVSIGIILIGLPILTLGGFIALSISPTLALLTIFQALRRSLNYGLFKPAREMLFTVLPREQKYKAKTFVDSFIYRGGDVVGALSQKALTAFHFGLGGVTILVIPVAAIWSMLAIFLGRNVTNRELCISKSKTNES